MLRHPGLHERHWQSLLQSHDGKEPDSLEILLSLKLPIQRVKKVYRSAVGELDLCKRLDKLQQEVRDVDFSVQLCKGEHIGLLDRQLAETRSILQSEFIEPHRKVAQNWESKLSSMTDTALNG